MERTEFRSLDYYNRDVTKNSQRVQQNFGTLNKESVNLKPPSCKRSQYKQTLKRVCARIHVGKIIFEICGYLMFFLQVQTLSFV